MLMPYRVKIWNKIAAMVTPFLSGKGKLVLLPRCEGAGGVKVKHYSILNLALALSDVSHHSSIGYFFQKAGYGGNSFLIHFLFLYRLILLLFLVPLHVLAGSCAFRNQMAMNDYLHVPATLVKTAAIGYKAGLTQHNTTVAKGRISSLHGTGACNIRPLPAY